MAREKTGPEPGGFLQTYWKQSRRPLICLAFVAPMLIIYEGGLLITGPEAARNGADVWLRELLRLTGFGQYFLLPLLTAGVLLGWHHISHQPWRIESRPLALMLAESIMWGFLVLGMARGLAIILPPAPATAAPTTPAPAGDIALQTEAEHAAEVQPQTPWQITASQLTGAFGAGIYEELLFRLMMLPVIAGALRLCKQSWRVSFGAATVITSLLFAAAHYRVFTGFGDDLQFYSFTFRFLAGVFFSLLFLYRGFGIAVGSHALYDTIVALHHLPVAEN